MPDWVNVTIRSFSMLVILFFMTKWLGKKQISQLNIFEYISGIVLGGIAAVHAIEPNANFMYALISMFIWFIVPFIAEFLSLKSKRFRDFTEGKSTVLIQDGKIMEDNLKKERYSTDDLLTELRHNNVFLASDVEFAVLEPSGELNVLLKKENRPLTAKDVGINVAPEKEPQTVIMDGEIMLESLANLSLNVNWLETELDKQNVSIENVFLAQADNNGQLYLDLYDDKITVPEPTEKALLLANLKKCQADLELFSLATENEESKDIYEKNSKKLQHAIDLVQPYL
ncbi:DUF421 domain-containing protein [Cerasibacillus sp. JNUCC 74]